MHGVWSITLQCGLIPLPAGCREDVFVLFVPPTPNNLTRVRLVLFHTRIMCETDIVVHIKVEEWARLATSLCDNEVIETDCSIQLLQYDWKVILAPMQGILVPMQGVPHTPRIDILGA